MSRRHNRGGSDASPRALRALPLTLAGIVILCPGLSSAQCGANSPAVPVPQCRHVTTTAAVACDTPGAVRLWPAAFRPGKPGETLPKERDSTDRTGGTTVPGALSGHELFKSVDVVGNHLFVAYNAGIQVWDIGGSNAESPARKLYRDGWMGHFLYFPPVSEQLNFIEDIAARNVAGTTRDLIVASGKFPVGPSIWEYDTVANGIRQLYQDEGSEARQVRIAQVANVYYAFAVNNKSISVYNASYAQSLPWPCRDNRGSVCPGVYLGEIPDIALSRFLDVLEANGKIYVASSNHLFVPMSIWELSAPIKPLNAVRKYDGKSLGNGVRGPAMFEHNGVHYLALVQNYTLKIYAIDNCLDANGCTDLGSPPGTPAWSTALAPWDTSEQFLTYSLSNGTPFIYFGLSHFSLSGADVDQLYDLTYLGTAGPIPEITAGGGTYVDPCSARTVDYWGDYYPRNEHGLRNMNPRVGKFNGNYFYRAAEGILDVHVRGGGAPPPPEDPTVTATAAESPPHWFDEPVGFAAAAQNCDGPELWTWYANDTDASGLGAGGANAAISWNRCGGNDCPEKAISVWAIKSSCAGDLNLLINDAELTVSDPWPRIRQVNVSPPPDELGEHPVCTVLSFTTTTDGKTPFTHSWTAKDGTGTVVASGSEANFQWDTSGVQLEDVFADGFEAGNTSAWSSAMGEEQEPTRTAMAPSRVDLRELVKASGGSATFEVTVEVTNPDQVPANHTTPVTLTSLGELAFDDPSIGFTDRGGGVFEFSVEAQNATRWRWELEDPIDGETTTCTAGYARCHVIEWGTQVELSHTWSMQDVATDYRVTVWIGNCEAADEPSAETAVTVPVGGDPPVMTTFKVALSSIQSTTNPNGPCIYTNFFAQELSCPRNVAIAFDVAASGELTEYQFDWHNDGTFEESIPAGTPVTHIFTTTGLKASTARAALGGLHSTSIDLYQTLTIVP